MQIKTNRKSGFTLVEIMIVVAIIGVLSAVAIPSFMKYIRRSKTTEASMNLRKLYDSSVTYYEAEHADATGNILTKQFPNTKAWTPPQGQCCTETGQKCGPPAHITDWTDPTWQALSFSIRDPHYYSYQYDSDGTQFTARAVGDLDGDGVRSTFERAGRLDNGGVSGSSGVWMQRELE